MSEAGRILRQKLAQQAISFIDTSIYQIGEDKYILSDPKTTLYLQHDLIRPFKKLIPDDYISLDNRFLRNNTVTGSQNTVIKVSEETSLQAAEQLVKDYPDEKIVILNFASAKKPGGGFLNGANAQEESLARSTTLYKSLIAAEAFYNINEASMSRTYTHNIIYSEDVIVFRTGDETCLCKPYKIDIITSPAVNRSITKEFDENYVDSVMIERAHRILAIASKHGAQHLILGAWGCGVFKNNPLFVAGMFKQLIEGQFNGRFKSVTFAILGAETYNCFAEVMK